MVSVSLEVRARRLMREMIIEARGGGKESALDTLPISQALHAKLRLIDVVLRGMRKAAYEEGSRSKVDSQSANESGEAS